VLTSAESWANAAERSLGQLPEQLAAAADVVAAPLAAIAAHPNFGEHTPPFDLLVLEEADRLTEADFLRVSRRARRWVLVGETAETPAGGRSLRPASLRPGFFQRLWDNLHDDSGRRPCSWHGRADGRLCCQMRPLTADERSRIETECVADRPDVELHILTSGRGAPELVAVVFPPGMSAADAKAYLFQELDELPIQTDGRGQRWRLWKRSPLAVASRS